MALASPKCKNCCVDGASPDAKYMMILLKLERVDEQRESYMAWGMQRVAKMLISCRKRAFQ